VAFCENLMVFYDVGFKLRAISDIKLVNLTLSH
jgi:hypothetical protein